jgi:hypothetical protein
MWQLYAIASVSCNALEQISDKRAMREEVGGAVATFIRVTFYTLLLIPLAALVGHPVHWYCTPGILLFSLINVTMASAYTVLMKHVNVTSIAVLSYLAPLIFLAIDRANGASFTVLQVLAIVGLVGGGVGFAIDSRPQFDGRTLFALACTLACSGAEAYYVKHVQRAEGIHILTILANMWGWVIALLALYLVASGKWRSLFTREAVRYARWSLLGKSLDTWTSVFWSLGLPLTTVAEYASMEVFFPPVMLLLVLFAQGVLGVDLGENVRGSAMARKAAAALLLVVSARYA